MGRYRRGARRGLFDLTALAIHRHISQYKRRGMKSPCGRLAERCGGLCVEAQFVSSPVACVELLAEALDGAECGCSSHGCFFRTLLVWHTRGSVVHPLVPVVQVSLTVEVIHALVVMVE